MYTLIVSLMIYTFVNILCYYMDSFILYNKSTFVGSSCLAFSLATSTIPHSFSIISMLLLFSLDNLKRGRNNRVVELVTEPADLQSFSVLRRRDPAGQNHCGSNMRNHYSDPYIPTLLTLFNQELKTLEI